MRTLIPILLFAFQLGAIVYARFVPTRYFCWAPYDIQTDYVATATVNGKQLTGAEFRRRYCGLQRSLDNRLARRSEDNRAKLGEQASLAMQIRIDEQTFRWRVAEIYDQWWNAIRRAVEQDESIPSL